MGDIVLSFDNNSAMDADKGGIVDKGGNYIIDCEYATWGQTKEGAKYIEISGDTDEGDSLNWLKVYHTQKNGNKHFEFAHLSALMGILQVSNLTAVKTLINGNECYICPELSNKRFGLGVQREDSDTYNDKGYVNFNLKIKHFYNPTTKQTFREIIGKSEAKTWNKPILDKLNSVQKIEQKNNNSIDTNPPFFMD